MRVLLLLALLGLAYAAERSGMTDMAVEKLLTATEDELKTGRSKGYCHGTGDPHYRTFNNQYYDYYHERELVLYHRGNVRLHSLTTKMVHWWSGRATTTALLLTDGTHNVIFRFTFRPGTPKPNQINGVQLLVNSVVTPLKVTNHLIRNGNLAYRYMGKHGNRWLFQFQDTKIGLVVNVQAYHWGTNGFMNQFIHGPSDGVTGLCQSRSQIHSINTASSLFPKSIMKRRAIVTGQHNLAPSKLNHLITAAKGDAKLVVTARAACAHAEINVAERHECAYDWLISPASFRPHVITEYKRLSKFTKASFCSPTVKGLNEEIKIKQNYCAKIWASHKTRGRKCMTDAVARFEKLRARAATVCAKQTSLPKCVGALNTQIGVVKTIFAACGTSTTCDPKSLNAKRLAARHATQTPCGNKNHAALAAEHTKNAKAHHHAAAAAKAAATSHSNLAATHKKHAETFAKLAATQTKAATDAAKLQKHHHDKYLLHKKKHAEEMAKYLHHKKQKEHFLKEAAKERKIAKEEAGKMTAASDAVTKHTHAANSALRHATHQKKLAAHYHGLAKKAELEASKYTHRATHYKNQHDKLKHSIASLNTALARNKKEVASNKAKAAAAATAAHEAFKKYSHNKRLAAEWKLKRDNHHHAAKLAEKRAKWWLKRYLSLKHKIALKETARKEAQRSRSVALSSYHKYKAAYEHNKKEYHKAEAKAKELGKAAAAATAKQAALTAHANHLLKTANHEARKARSYTNRAGRRGKYAKKLELHAAKHKNKAAHYSALAAKHQTESAATALAAQHLKAKALKELETYRSDIKKAYAAQLKANSLQWSATRFTHRAARHTKYSEHLARKAAKVRAAEKKDEAISKTAKAKSLDLRTRAATASGKANTQARDSSKAVTAASTARTSALTYLSAATKAHKTSAAAYNKASLEIRKIGMLNHRITKLTHKINKAKKLKVKYADRNVKLVAAAQHSGKEWTKYHNAEIAAHAEHAKQKRAEAAFLRSMHTENAAANKHAAQIAADTKAAALALSHYHADTKSAHDERVKAHKANHKGNTHHASFKHYDGVHKTQDAAKKVHQAKLVAATAKHAKYTALAKKHTELATHHHTLATAFHKSATKNHEIAKTAQAVAHVNKKAKEAALKKAKEAAKKASAHAGSAKHHAAQVTFHHNAAATHRATANTHAKNAAHHAAQAAKQF